MIHIGSCGDGGTKHEGRKFAIKRFPASTFLPGFRLFSLPRLPEGPNTRFSGFQDRPPSVLLRAMQPAIGVIGGSGLYQIDSLTETTEHVVETPFGPPSDVIVGGKLAGRQVFFLPRHGRG